MDSVVFYHSRGSHYTLYWMVILAAVLGLGLDILLLHLTGISKGPEFAPAFIQEDPRLGIWIIFGSIPIFMLIPVFLAIMIWGKAIEKSGIEFREKEALLSYQGRKIRIPFGEAEILPMTRRTSLCHSYQIRTPQEKIIFTTPLGRVKEHSDDMLSLDEVMGRLELHIQKDRTGFVRFYGMQIHLWSDTPKIFENTAYYLDRRDWIMVENDRIMSCMVRERKDPEHVVGDLLMNIEGLRTKDPKELFERQLIIEVIELDEQITLV